MYSTSNYIVSNKSNRHEKRVRRQKCLTESRATKRLHHLFYAGCGERFLGWQVGDSELLDDGSWKKITCDGPRRWKTPSREDRFKWNPFWDHLKGCFRGVASGVGESHVPFVSSDLDRHHAGIPAKDHINACLQAWRFLVSKFNNLLWLAEVNPKNGSMKFFGFSPDGKHIPIDKAKQIAAKIHTAQIEAGIGDREVFPHNSPQVMLPMRPDKITVIDSGILPRCTRKKKNPTFGTMEPFKTYSSIEFIRWISRRHHCDQWTMHKTLSWACGNLPDVEAGQQSTCSQGKRSQKSQQLPVQTVDTPQKRVRLDVLPDDNPNSFERQLDALLVYCRKAKRVVYPEEALDHIRRNKLFSGDWDENWARRNYRVRYILDFIAQTFDPTKCGYGAYDLTISKYDPWAKMNCPDGWRDAGRTYVDEWGTVTRKRFREVAQWQHVSFVLSIFEFCMIIVPNEDGSVPQVWAEDIWNKAYQAGQIDKPWSWKRWDIICQKLKELGIVESNGKWRRQQAMIWRLGKWFPGLGFWKSEKMQRYGVAVPLQEFLSDNKRNNNNLLNYYTGHCSLEIDQDHDFLAGRPPP